DARRRAGQPEGLIEFTVGEESRVTGDRRAVELQLDLAIEINTQGVILAVTHWVPRSFRQERVGNAGFSRVLAQTSCRKSRSIWEMWVHNRSRVEGWTRTGRAGSQPRQGRTWAVESPGRGYERPGAGPLPGANTGSDFRAERGHLFVQGTTGGPTSSGD